MTMIRLKYYTTLLFIFLLAASCRKVINLDLGNHTGELVIEGNFTYELDTQVVKLSRNVPFTNTNTYPPVTGATVTMDNHHGRIVTFTERAPGYYSAGLLGGTLGRTYTLTVVTDGKTYTADSTMPTQEVQFDSIAFKSSIFGTNKNRRGVTVYFQDPADVANQYRFVMFVNHVQVKNVFAFNDEFINGKYVNLDLQENDIDIYPKDTVTVEMQCIDKPMYTYWYTLMQQQGDNPGGAIAPANPPTNITPVTLGYFSAHTTQTITEMVR
jgi:hypothetical protein